MGAEAVSARPAVDPFAPPDDATVNRAIEDYARLVREAYGPRLKGIYLFGSRARGDHRPESDADIAVILRAGGWDVWSEIKTLSGLEYDVVAATGADVQGWPVAEGEWAEPGQHSNPGLVQSMRRDAKQIPVRT